MDRPSKIVMACPAKRPWAGVNGGEIMMRFCFLFPLGKIGKTVRIQRPLFQEGQGQAKQNIRRNEHAKQQSRGSGERGLLPFLRPLCADIHL